MRLDISHTSRAHPSLVIVIYHLYHLWWWWQREIGTSWCGTKNAGNAGNAGHAGRRRICGMGQAVEFVCKSECLSLKSEPQRCQGWSGLSIECASERSSAARRRPSPPVAASNTRLSYSLHRLHPHRPRCRRQPPPATFASLRTPLRACLTHNAPQSTTHRSAPRLIVPSPARAHFLTISSSETRFQTRVARGWPLVLFLFLSSLVSRLSSFVYYCCCCCCCCCCLLLLLRCSSSGSLLVDFQSVVGSFPAHFSPSLSCCSSPAF
jgi:hypothetical protein